MYPTPLLLTNGTILTMDERLPHAEAIGIDRATGRILAVGAERDVRAALGIFTACEIVDLHGRTVIPGLMDAHTHILAAARDTIEADLAGCADETEAVARVAAVAATTPKGEWIVGRHWNQNEWPGKQFPTRTRLDAAVPEHPVLLLTHSQHAAWVNGRALQLAGIDAEAADPPGGVIAREADGTPSGMLFETAMSGIRAICEEATAGEARTLAALRDLLRRYAERGLTGVTVMEGALSLRLAQELGDAHALPLRLGYYLPVAQLPALREIGLRDGFGDAMVRLHGIKIFADGALGTRTAAMRAPYAGEPGNSGIITTPLEQMEREVAEATRGALGVAIHAIGDRAVQIAIQSIARALARQPAGIPTRRYRIEHVQLASGADLRRMAQLGIVGSVQPYHAVSDRDVADRVWGARAATSYAYATMARMGIRVALGSDTPIETADPWRILHAAVARTSDLTPERPAWHPAEALTVTQALWGYTVGAAWAAGDESRVGQLRAGLLGDCVILAEDPLHVPIGEIARMPVAATIVGGEVAAGSLEG